MLCAVQDNSYDVHTLQSSLPGSQLSSIKPKVDVVVHDHGFEEADVFITNTNSEIYEYFFNLN